MVKKLLNFVRNWWIKVRLNAPPFVQRTLILRLHEVKEIVRLITKPYLPVYQLRGQGQAGPLTVTYIGLDYAKPLLKSFLFSEEPVEKKVGQIPWWRSKELANFSEGDLVIVEATKHLIHRLPRQNAVILPQYVHHTVDVRGSWEDVRARFRKNTRKYKLRLVRKYNYDYQISHSEQDFETFFREMYLPTMADRHGELSSPMSKIEAYQYFQNGYLFQVTREGEWVSGIICHPQQTVLSADILGVKNADEQLIQEGATFATYYVVLDWANQNGYEGVNFLGSGPYLKIGLFQHKRSWGATVTVPPHLHRRVWLRVRRNTPAVTHFLKENPLVIIDEVGQLHGLILVDNPHEATTELRKEWEDSYATPGLSSLLVRSVNGLAKEEPAKLNDFNLVIPVPVSSHSGDGQ